MSSKLNPDSDAARFFRPLESHRRTRNAVYLKALDNYALHQAAQADDVTRAREGAIESDEDNEQYLLVPPEDYDDILTGYINLDAFADELAERQAKAYTWCDMDNDDYY